MWCVTSVRRRSAVGGTVSRRPHIAWHGAGHCRRLAAGGSELQDDVNLASGPATFALTAGVSV